MKSIEKILDYTGLSTLIKELKNIFALKAHSHTKSQITDFPTSLKNPTNIKVQLNGGTTEGTNQFTYDGSTAKTVNITASKIGAANSSHVHTISNISELQERLDGKSNNGHKHVKSDITDFPATLKNPTAMTVQLNGGTTEGTNKFTYDGGTAKSMNITPASIGAAASSHGTHVTYSTTAPKANGTASAGTATNVSRGDHVHPLQTTISGNAGSATKLATARTISLAGDLSGSATFDGSANISITAAVKDDSHNHTIANVDGLQTELDKKSPTNHTHGEATLTWGGKNLVGSISPVDTAASYLHSANRFQFAKPAGITVEYSTNGSTYNSYSTNDAAKINLVSGIGGNYYVGGRSTGNTVNDKLRITLNASNMSVYTTLKKLLINVSTNGASGSKVIVETATIGNPSSFTVKGEYNVEGWSGWNSIPMNIVFGGSSTQTSQIAAIRLTFSSTKIGSQGLGILDIFAIGETYWRTPSQMAKTGHLYTWNTNQESVFPAKVTAPTFAGALSGNASTATKATQDSSAQKIDETYIKGLSVNGRVITYTKGNGSTGTITTQDTNTTYGTATASTAGIGKLYTGTGSATDGSMTQAAITNAINSKSAGNKNVISSTEPSCNVNDEWLLPY